jgi:hypothetical protein
MKSCNERPLGAGHHALDVRAVLGTVQGSTLRFARALARPSGLDVPARSSPIGSYVMAVSLNARQPIL